MRMDETNVPMTSVGDDDVDWKDIRLNAVIYSKPRTGRHKVKEVKDISRHILSEFVSNRESSSGLMPPDIYITIRKNGKLRVKLESMRTSWRLPNIKQ